MWKLQLKLFWAEFMYQISFFWYKHGSYKWQRRAQYLKALRDHIKRERRKMWEKYWDPITRRWFPTLWQYIMWRDNRECKIPSPYCPMKANQVDHIKPVSRWGFSIPRNLQAAADVCNKWKGAKML